MDSTWFPAALVAGAVAGTTVDVSLFPLDTLKTRLQSAAGFRAAGGFQGVYAGLGSAIVGSAPGAALFFVSYEQVKSLCGQNRPRDHMLAASVGEIAACAVRVPTEVVKQRAQAHAGYTSSQVLRQILQQRQNIGLPGVWLQLYRGWSITIMRELPFTAIQFPIWEALKQSRQVSAVESACFGSVAGAIAAAITTPLDVLKTRMMLAKDKNSVLHFSRILWAERGPKAFFAGLGPRVMWISAGGAIFLGSYQSTANFLTA